MAIHLEFFKLHLFTYSGECAWSSEDNLWKPVLPSYHVGLGTGLRESDLAESVLILRAIPMALVLFPWMHPF